MATTSALIKAADLPERLRLYCPDLVQETKLIETWIGKKLKDYTPEGFANLVKMLLAEVVVLTGGTLAETVTRPDGSIDEERSPMYRIQVNAISKFLLGSFGNLTYKETINAFYMSCEGKFGKPVAQYGMDLNAVYIGTVLSAYVEYKKTLLITHHEELKKVLLPPAPLPEGKPMTDDDVLNLYRGDIQRAYAVFIDELDLQVEFCPEYFYDTLEKDGYIEQGAYESYLTDAKNKEAHSLHVEALHNAERDGQIGKVLRKMRAGKVRVTTTVAKQMAVKEFFLIAMRKEIKCLYVKEQTEESK